MKLLLNAVQCKSCNEIIVSTHRHDFKTCKCGKVSVDGGLEYKRRTFHEDGDYVERCAYSYYNNSLPGTKPNEATGKFIVWSPGGKTNPAVIFDHVEDAMQSAKELAARVSPSDWFVAKLEHVPVPR